LARINGLACPAVRNDGIFAPRLGRGRVRDKSPRAWLRNQGEGHCQRDGVDYNVAYIPPDFDVPAREAFDQTYMKALFERGFELARSGSPWHKFPPGFDEPIEVPSAGP
jgi:hypothetical protein